MKIVKLALQCALASAALFLTGCQTLGGSTAQSVDRKLGGFVVGALYGRSGVFVTNNAPGHTIAITTNNGISVNVRFGETAQLYTTGMLNGNRMLVVAKFFDSAGEYVGYDSRIFSVYYSNGGPFVREWEPRLRRSRDRSERG